jgi:hypothetical protein
MLGSYSGKDDFCKLTVCSHLPVNPPQQPQIQRNNNGESTEENCGRFHQLGGYIAEVQLLPQYR